MIRAMSESPTPHAGSPDEPARAAPEHAPGTGAYERRGVSAVRGASGAAGSRYAIVVSRFNQAITDSLFNAAVDVLLDAGAAPGHIRAVQVPGAVEIPLATRELAHTAHYAAIIALGCVVRGETAHFDYVCRAVTDGCLQVQLEFGVPVGFGVITAETIEQAFARSAESRESGAGFNAGAAAAYAALEMAGLVRGIRSS